ncbi:uncharacterized protein LOC100839281 [Brachypodium distachyon]|uniref:FLZ-type domain-containing protein n=1 Tax=Brachypodium distachyon TaxID=15368 RepID=I1GZM4_BRADI|nr:uncharacterized protein LOC100839281 [Brachypodium distachyon]KQK18909.1 hypothetical protein BRADI_1g45410v3 [Brachypodium distachyon]|eukprot:XP_003564065.1 uncharacterized protein LOC100839281 [Brachypodium distachyon]
MTTLGKRHRNDSSLRRTTSMSGFEVPGAEEAGRQPTRAARGGSAAPTPSTAAVCGGAVQRRHSGDFHAAMETAAFLQACGLCSRRLGPGRDTFIYMGEVAFCSLECRQQQMNLDELKDKKCFPPAGSAGSDGTSSTVAAA